MFFLLPPSEGKLWWWGYRNEKLSFIFSKPLDIAFHATQKDLKCTWARYEEWIVLNKCITKWPWMPVIQRYTGVMFKAIDYLSLNSKEKECFNSTVRILSGVYGITTPTDQIGNYKLPIATKGLLSFRWTSITDILNTLPQKQIVDLLPWSYKKLIQWWELKHEVLHVDFFQEWKKLTHTVKWVKWRWLRRKIQLWVKRIEVWETIYEDEKWPVLVVVTPHD